MKTLFTSLDLPPTSVLLTCSSHEDRCQGLIKRMDNWRPEKAIVFHYDDKNRRREVHHRQIVSALKKHHIAARTLQFIEADAVKSLHDNMGELEKHLCSSRTKAVVLDISVFTKRHLFMMLRWLDDKGYWDNLWIVYSEPDEYDVSEFIPLSFGLSSLHQIPGFSACPDLSRPLHLVLFAGYEGDRALAAYEQIQPMITTLVIPYPAYKPLWEGRTEAFNADLIKLIGCNRTFKADAIDPESSTEALQVILFEGKRRSAESKIVCPLGTKPQALGIYMYVRSCSDPPAVIYAGPLRHNHEFFSHGIGRTWLLKVGK